MGRRLTAREKLAAIEQRRKDLKRQVREEDKHLESERAMVAVRVLQCMFEEGVFDEKIWRSYLDKNLVKPKERLLLGLDLEESTISAQNSSVKPGKSRNKTDLAEGEFKGIMESDEPSHARTAIPSESDKLSKILGRTIPDNDDDDLAVHFNTAGI